MTTATNAQTVRVPKPFLLLCGKKINFEDLCKADAEKIISILTGKYAALIRGGGAKSIISIGMIENLLNRNLSPKAVSGTSIGAVIAILLASGHFDKASEFFNELIELFSTSARPISNGDFSIMEDSLRKILGNQTISDCKMPLFVPLAVKKTSAFNFLRVLLNPEQYVVSNTKNELNDLTLSRLGHLAVLFPVLYKSLKLDINGDNHIVVDGGLCKENSNPFIPANSELPEDYKRVLFTFIKPRDNESEIFKNNTDLSFLIPTNLGTLGTREDSISACKSGKLYIDELFIKINSLI